MTARTKQQLYDRFCSGGSAKNSISQIETEFEDLIDTFFGTLTDYSDDSTIVGWSSFTTKHIYYTRISNLIFVSYRLIGSGNSTTITFTLPFTAASGPRYLHKPGKSRDDGTWQSGAPFGRVLTDSDTISFLKAEAGGSWSSGTGARELTGEFWYIKA